MLSYTHLYQKLTESVKIMTSYDIKNGWKRVCQIEVGADLWKFPAALELVGCRCRLGHRWLYQLL